MRTKVCHFFATMKQLFLVVSNSSSAKTLNRCRKNENSASCVYVVLRILNLSNFMLMLNWEGMKKKIVHNIKSARARRGVRANVKGLAH